MLGTNGGGFFNANSAHPFENPNAITNLVADVCLIFSIGAALTNMFGRMVGNERQGWAIFAVMGVLFLAGMSTCLLGRSAGQSGLRRLPCRSGAVRAAGRRQHGRQGSPLRHRQFDALFATVTTDASCGAVNTMHDSLYAARRHGADGQHHARRDHLRRRRLRPLRHAALRDPRGVHRRADGRAHAGISRQEDRSEGGEDGDARHPHPAAVDPRLHRARRGRAGRPRGHRQ